MDACRCPWSRGPWRESGVVSSSAGEGSGSAVPKSRLQAREGHPDPREQRRRHRGPVPDSAHLFHLVCLHHWEAENIGDEREGEVRGVWGAADPQPKAEA